MTNHDPHWDWDEITDLAGHSYWIRGQCQHRDVIPVPDTTGHIVAGLCLTCDQQLPTDLITQP